MSWLNKAKNVANQARGKITEADTKALMQKAKASSSDTVSSISKNSTQAIDSVKKSLEDIVSRSHVARGNAYTKS